MHRFFFFLSFFIFLSICSSCVFFLLFLSFLLWHLRNSFPLRTQYLITFLLLLLLLLFEIGFVIQNSKRVLRRTSAIKRFIWNAMSFCLIFETLLYPVRLALGVGNLCMRNPLDVLPFLYRSLTPTYTLSIPLFPNLLHIQRNTYCSYTGAHF